MQRIETIFTAFTLQDNELRASLEDHLRFPDNVNEQELIKDIEFLRNSMLSNRGDIQLSIQINQFIRYLAHKLPIKEQIEFYLLAADFYPSKKDDYFCFEPVWLLTKALSLCESHHIQLPYESIQGKLDAYEYEIINYPKVKNVVRINSEKFVSAIHVAIQVNKEKFNEKLTAFYEKIDDLISAGNFDLVKDLYESLRGILGDHNLHSNFMTFNERQDLATHIKSLKGQLPKKEVFNSSWNTFRRKFQAIKHLSSKGFSPKMRELLGDILKHSHTTFESLAPCAYEVLDKSSLSRDEATRCSDVDCAFLMEDEEKKESFLNDFLPPYLTLCRFYLGCMDDQWVIDSTNSIFPIERVGCDIDEGDIEHILGTKKIHFSNVENRLPILLVRTPQSMLTWITEGKFDDLVALPRSLIFAKSLFSSSPKANLFGEFQSLLASWWKEPVYQHFIKSHLMNFSKRKMADVSVVHPQKDNLINIKRRFIHPMMCWTFDLAFHLKISKFNTVEDVLNNLKQIPQYFLQGFREAWDFVLYTRWKIQQDRTNAPDASEPNRVYLRNTPQNQFNPPDRYCLPVLTYDQIEVLENIDKNFLEPAYALLESIVRTNTLDDPLLALCQTHLNKISVSDLSHAAILGKLITNLRRRNMGLDSSNIPKAKRHSVSIPDELYIWLIKDYKRHTQSKRILWLTKLLEIDALFDWCIPEELNTLINKIIYLPMEDGWRIKQDLELLLFCERAKEIFIKSCDDPLEVCVSLIDLDDPFSFNLRNYFVKRIYREQFLDAEGRFIEYPHEVPAQHTTVPIKIEGQPVCWIKVCPENASMEELSRQIDCRLTGGDVPPSLVVKIKALNRFIPAIVIQHLQGDRMSKANEAIDKIAISSFTRTLARIFACSPEDDKPEDYFLKREKDGSYSLKRGDNERLLCKSMQKGLFRNIPTEKSIIFFLDLMQEKLDLTVIEDILSISPQKMAKSIIEHMAKYHQFCKRIFSLEDVSIAFKFPYQKIWNIRMSDVCILPVYLNKQWLVKLFGNLSALYWRLDQREITGNELLHSLHPSLYKAVQYGWKNPTSKNLHIALRRLDGMGAYHQDSSLHRASAHSGLHCVSMALGIPTLTLKDIQMAYENKENSPTQALMLMDEMEKNALIDVRTKLHDLDPTFVIAFGNLFAQHQNEILKEGGTLSPFKQQLLLKGLAKIKAKIHDFDLTPYSTSLTDDLFENILRRHGKRLSKINISGCKLLRDASIRSIRDYCPNVKIIICKACSFKKIELGNLKFLECLNVKNCQDLILLNFTTLVLKELNITDCTKLEIKNLSSTLRAPFALLIFRFDDLMLQREWEALNKYPFLLAWYASLPLDSLEHMASVLDRIKKENGRKIDPANEKQIYLITQFLNILSSGFKDLKSLNKNKYLHFWRKDFSNDPFTFYEDDDLISELRNSYDSEDKSTKEFEECDNFYKYFQSCLEDYHCWELRHGAQEALKDTQVYCEWDIKPIFGALLTGTKKLSLYALEALSTVRPDHPKIETVILGPLYALKDSKHLIRTRALHVLNKIAYQNSKVNRAITCRSMFDKKASVREEALKLLKTQVNTVVFNSVMNEINFWFRQLNSSSGEQRFKAAKALASITETYDITSTQTFQLLAELDDMYWGIRKSVVEALGNIEPSETPRYNLVIDGLLEALKDPNSQVRAQAVKSLGNIPLSYPRGSKVLDVILHAINDKEGIVSLAALQSLTKIISHSSSNMYNQTAIDLSVKFLKNKKLVPYAVKALGKLISRTVESQPIAIKAVINCLDNSTYPALKALEKILVSLTKDQGGINGEKILENLYVQSGILSWNVSQNLVKNGLAKEIADNLAREMLRKPSNYQREIGAFNINNSSLKINSIVRFYLALLKCPGHKYRYAAANALGELESPHPFVIDALIEALSDGHPNVRIIAAKSLAKLKPKELRVVDALIDLLGDVNRIVRCAASEALAKLEINDSSRIERIMARIKSQFVDYAEQLVESISVSVNLSELIKCEPTNVVLLGTNYGLYAMMDKLLADGSQQ